MKKYRLKKKYKNALTFILITFILNALLFGLIELYNIRVNSIKDKTPGSVPLYKIFKK